MKQKLLIFSTLLFLFFQGCAPIVYTEHEAKVIVYKTPKTSYADAGFIHHNGEDLKVEILMVGQPVFTLEVGRKICLDGLCLKKSKWIQKNLSPYYPATIVQNIFLGKPIFDREGYEATPEGFSQKVVRDDAYDISYSVTPKLIRFKDKQNYILIKIKTL